MAPEATLDTATNGKWTTSGSRYRMMRTSHSRSSTAATFRGNPFSQGTHTIMTRFLTCICVLVGTALTVAAGSDSPSPEPQQGEARSQAQNAPQALSPHAFSPHEQPQRTYGESRGPVRQPGRIEYSYPLKGDQERNKSAKALQQLTVDLLALHNTYKEAHWDLTGPLHVPLHEYFQQQADFYYRQADLFAERMLHLGASVDGRFSTIAAHDQARRVARRIPDRRSRAQASAGSRHRVAEGDLRPDRRDRGERPADG